MSQNPGFKEKMFQELSIKQTDLEHINGSFKSYRNKFVAHLDSEEIARLPKVGEGLPLVYFYYKEVKAICENTSDWPEDLEEFYKVHYEKGRHHYDREKT